MPAALMHLATSKTMKVDLYPSRTIPIRPISKDSPLTTFPIGCFQAASPQDGDDYGEMTPERDGLTVVLREPWFSFGAQRPDRVDILLDASSKWLLSVHLEIGSAGMPACPSRPRADITEWFRSALFEVCHGKSQEITIDAGARPQLSLSSLVRADLWNMDSKGVPAWVLNKDGASLKYIIHYKVLGSVVPDDGTYDVEASVVPAQSLRAQLASIRDERGLEMPYLDEVSSDLDLVASADCGTAWTLLQDKVQRTFDLKRSNPTPPSTDIPSCAVWFRARPSDPRYPTLTAALDVVEPLRENESTLTNPGGSRSRPTESR